MTFLSFHSQPWAKTSITSVSDAVGHDLADSNDGRQPRVI
jgi:hypothetical protein